jgi:hypothetical protein
MFFDVWIHPRKVIQLILENEPGYFVWPMVLTFSFLEAFHPSKLLSVSKYLSFPLSLFGDVVIGWLFGILVFLIYSRVVLVIGKWSGGKGTYLEVKTACAWAYPPLFVGLIFEFLRKISNLKMVFQGNMDLKDFFSAPMSDWHYVLTGISFLLAFWCLSLTVINVAQAHKISIWKSVFATTIFWVLGWLVTFIIVMLRWVQASTGISFIVELPQI